MIIQRTVSGETSDDEMTENKSKSRINRTAV